MKEVWKDIENYEGYYQVSNLGKIRNNNLQVLKDQNGPSGYRIITLWKNNIPKTFRVHRLVAKAFIPTDNYNKTVNHKNENKTDNRVCNLEWMTSYENDNYGTRNQRLSELQNPYKKEIAQLTVEGDLVGLYPSVAAAGRKMGGRSKCSNIFAVLGDRRIWAYDYCWCYRWEYEKYFRVD